MGRNSVRDIDLGAVSMLKVVVYLTVLIFVIAALTGCTARKDGLLSVKASADAAITRENALFKQLTDANRQAVTWFDQDGAEPRSEDTGKARDLADAIVGHVGEPDKPIDWRAPGDLVAELAEMKAETAVKVRKYEGELKRAVASKEALEGEVKGLRKENAKLRDTNLVLDKIVNLIAIIFFWAIVTSFGLAAIYFATFYRLRHNIMGMVYAAGALIAGVAAGAVWHLYGKVLVNWGIVGVVIGAFALAVWAIRERELAVRGMIILQDARRLLTDNVRTALDAALRSVSPDWFERHIRNLKDALGIKSAKPQETP